MNLWLLRTLLTASAGLTLFGLSKIQFSLNSSQFLSLGGVLSLALCMALIWQRHPRVAAGLVLTLALVVSLPAAAAWALILIACWSLGVRILPMQGRTLNIAALALRVTVGLAVLTALFSVLLPWPVNSPLVYAAVLMLIVGWAWPSLKSVALSQLTLSATPTLPVLLVSLLLAIAALLIVPGFFPLVEFDALALHERMANELWFSGRYAFDVASHNWAAAPFATDLLYALGFVLSGGEEDVRAYQFLSMLLMLSGLFLGLLPRQMSGAVRAFLLALMLSTPLFFYLAHTLHAEMLLLVYLLAGVYLLCAAGIAPSRRLLVMSVLCGALAATKVTGLVISGGLALVALTLFLRTKIDGLKKVGVLTAALLVGLMTGGQSYFWAWYTSGNPVLPLYNSVFASRYFDATDFSDTRWVGKLDWTYPYDLLFDTGRFVEWSDAGWAGFQYLFLLAAAMCGLFSRFKLPRLLALLLLLYVAGVLPSTQYLRYQLPAMLLISLMAAYGLHRVLKVDSVWRRLCLGFLGVCVVANIARFSVIPYPPGLAWTPYVADPVRLNQTLEKLAPERQIAAVYNALYEPEFHLLVNSASRLYWAPFRGRVTVAQWYNHEHGLRFHAITSVDGARQHLHQQGVTHVIIYEHAGSVAEQKLAEAVTGAAILLKRVGEASLYQLVTPVWSGDDLPVAGQNDFRALAANWIVDREWSPQPTDGALAIQSGQSMHWPFPLLPGHRYRYLFEFSCAINGAAAIQVNWEDSTKMLATQYEPVRCSGGAQQLTVDLHPVPGAVQGRLYLRTHENHPVSVLRAAIFADEPEQVPPNRFMPARYREH